MERRDFLRNTLAMGAAALVSPHLTLAQATDRVAQYREDARKKAIFAYKLYDNVYLLQGAGGNMVVQTGAQGKILIDSSFSTAAETLLATLHSLGPDANHTLINTHWHFDHTDGNEAMHAAGFAILAHQKTRERLSTPQTVKVLNISLPASPEAALPVVTFDHELHLWHNGDSLDLVHFDPAHTDSDIYIHFHKANVVHLGDIWFNGLYPFIDESSGGSIGGMIRATEQSLALVTESTKIIPGHGKPGQKPDLMKYHDMLRSVRDKVAALKAAGASEQETTAKKPTADFDEKWGQGLLTPDQFVGIVYRTI